MASKRQASKMASQLPRTGLQISNLRQTFQRKELDEFIEKHPDMLETIVFVCKSGMLQDVREDLRKEHWLPQSNKYFHNVSRAFFGTALTQLHPDITIELLQKLTETDGDIIWKLLFLATGTHKQSKVPTLHKLSFFALLQTRYTSLGSRLHRLDWKAAALSQKIDFQVVGVYSKIVVDGQVVGFKHVGGNKVQLKRPYPDHMVLVKNWSEKDAMLMDTKTEEEDDVHLRKRFKAIVPEVADWTSEEVSAAEGECNAEAVKLTSDKVQEEASVAGPCSATQPKKHKAETKTTDKEVPAAPVITPIKITRQSKGALHD